MAEATLPLSAEQPRLPLELLQPYQRQARKEFDEDELNSLAESIKAHGVMQPVVVRPVEDGRFEILAGERRWRASKMAGKADIPVVLRSDLSSEDAQVLHLVENLQRADLSLAEVCEGVRELVRDVGVEKAALELGRSEAWVSKRAGVLDMPTPIQQLVAGGKVADLEIVGTIAQIQKVDPERADRIISTIKQPQAWEKPVTRDSVRQELKRAQEVSKQREQEARDQAKRQVDEEKEQARASKAEAQRKERERLMARVKDGRKKLKDEALETMRSALGFAEKDMERFNAPIRLDYVMADFGAANTDARSDFPESPEACRFEFRGTGDVAQLLRITAGFIKKPKISVRLPDLTLDQAARLEAALQDVDDIHLWFDTTMSGKDLKAVAKRLSTTSPEKQGDLTISSFLTQRVGRAKAGAIKAADLYAAYQDWCSQGGFEPVPLNDNRWGDAIAQAGIEKKRLKTGWHYQGVRLCDGGATSC